MGTASGDPRFSAPVGLRAAIRIEALPAIGARSMIKAGVQ